MTRMFVAVVPPGPALEDLDEFLSVRRSARVLFAGLGGSFDDLCRATRTAASVSGIAADSQRFHPHLTVCEAGSAGRRDALAAAAPPPTRGRRGR